MMEIRISYGDGNGNQYNIKPESIEYLPIKPHLSSSGIYNGGDHVKKTITQHQYETLLSIFNEAVANEASHVKDRVKGSGAITIRKGYTEISRILSPNSETLNEIERILKDMINK